MTRRTPTGADRDDVRTVIFCALELALDVAYHDGDARDLAVASEAYRMAGYHDEGATAISHATREEVARGIEDARRGRPHRLLRADARGMLAGFQALASSGAITTRSVMEAKHQRWIARGGHNMAVAS